MFFSVRKSVAIGGKTYIPCVCYEGSKVLEDPVNRLVQQDLAVVYPERVYFQNGKLLQKSSPKKKPQQKAVEPAPVKQEPETEPEVSEAKQTKKKRS